MRKSYAHDTEDLIVEKAIGNVQSFLDIGANDGIKYSNVYKFARSGAKGLCYEPIPSIFKRLKENYSKFDKVICVNEAVSNKIDNINMIDAGVLSHITATEDPELTCRIIYDNPAMPVRNVWVDCSTMVEVEKNWKEKVNKEVPDVMSIDVEGHEHLILSKLSYNFRPKLIIVETHCYTDDNVMTWKHKHYDDIIDKLVHELDYGVLSVTAMNTIFIRKDY